MVEDNLTMSKIKILPEILSNKIAAGEVVERPASVVKELVENSLDAGSTRIIIEVEKGGRSLIRVSDNGVGMSHDDALLAIERYGTSKLYKESDLFSIKTLGFRGEALPSIASVSRFALETRDEASVSGVRVFIEGGHIRNVSEIGAPAGTLIAVEQLFFNTPARRKFLKTINTEMGHIADTVASMALGRPDVLFRLSHNKKPVKNWPAVSDPGDRIADVLGREMRNDLFLIPESGTDDTVTVSGWIASPRMARTTSRGIYIYVNGRFVRDRTIQHALFEGYAGRLMKGQFPPAVLFISVPADHVDVNVHPRKNEVRFLHQNKVHTVVADAVSAVLNLADRPRPVLSRPQSEPWMQNDEPEPLHISEPAPAFPQEIPSSHSPRSSRNLPGNPFHDVLPRERLHKPVPENENHRSRRKQSLLWDKKEFSDLRVIGQLHNTYILCESEEGLMLIDQHAAHERILFEQLKDRSSASEMRTQNLLIPETVDMGYEETNILEKLIPHLRETGLDIEPFGGNTFVVKSVPAILGKREIRPLIIEIVEKMAEIGFASALDNAMNECLSLMACHGAIKANQHLSREEIKGLLNQLEACENPSHCPHGRPLWIKWSTRVLEKSFRRVV